MKDKIAFYLKRLLITLILAALFVGGINEGAHLLFKEDTDRAPKTITIEVPAGTAERVEAGQEVPSIPNEMVFVVGDTLKVVNHDSVDHELGPLYIPAGKSASLLMENANKYVLGCSFQPSQYLGFDVRDRTTANSRLEAFMLAAPPTTMFFFVYSLLLFPLKEGQNEPAPGEET